MKCLGRWNDDGCLSSKRRKCKIEGVCFDLSFSNDGRVHPKLEGTIVILYEDEGPECCGNWFKCKFIRCEESPKCWKVTQDSDMTVVVTGETE